MHILRVRPVEELVVLGVQCQCRGADRLKLLQLQGRFSGPQAVDEFGLERLPGFIS